MAKQRKRCAWILPDELWQRMQPLLPRYRKSRKGGRPRVDLRIVANGIFYVLRTGCQWKAAPREFASGSTLHRYFQEWTEAGVFRRLWKAALLEYDELEGNQRVAATSTSVSTKATTRKTFASFFSVDITILMSNREGRNTRKRKTILASKRDDGLLNALILGSIAFVGYLSAGKRKPIIILPSCISHSHGQRSTLREFWDRLLVLQLRNAPRATKDALRSLMEKINERGTEFIAKTTPVIIAAN